MAELELSTKAEVAKSGKLLVDLEAAQLANKQLQMKASELDNNLKTKVKFNFFIFVLSQPPSVPPTINTILPMTHCQCPRLVAWFGLENEGAQ